MKSLAKSTSVIIAQCKGIVPKDAIWTMDKFERFKVSFGKVLATHLLKSLEIMPIHVANQKIENRHINQFQ